MTEATNLLVIVLDALREDAVEPSLEDSGRCFKARTCISSAPWTLPSCTSLITGVDTFRHRHFWHADPPVSSNLVRALPDRYRKVGLVNNTVLLPASGLDQGFDRWTYMDDHSEPFERAARAIGRARRRRPLFLLLHSNIPHDYYRPQAGAYYDEAFPDRAGGACILGNRVIRWSGTTAAEREAVARTYRASAMKAMAHTREILDLVRARDDFVSVIVSDHGEGCQYDLGRVHHGGRVHDDLLRVPLYVDLPSTVGDARKQDVADALATKVLSTTDVLPTLMALVGAQAVPGVDGVAVERVPEERVVVSEDRRYLYLKNRFRLNVRGLGKNMSESDREENRLLTDQLAGAPIVRSYRSKTAKLIMTCLQLRAGKGSTAEDRDTLRELGQRLLGSPALVASGDRLYGFELFDLERDPSEQENLLGSGSDGLELLRAKPWTTMVTAPVADGDGDEVPVATILESAERM